MEPVTFLSDISHRTCPTTSNLKSAYNSCRLTGIQHRPLKPWTFGQSVQSQQLDRHPYSPEYPSHTSWPRTVEGTYAR